MNNLIYKIRRKSDGLFSTGGNCPKFTKVGKTWKAIGHVKNHLGALRNGNGLPYYADDLVRPTAVAGVVIFNNIYEDCELVSYALQERTAQFVPEFVSECVKSKYFTK